MEELLLGEDEVPARLREWLETAPVALALTIERLPDGRVLLRPNPEVDPTMLAQLRVTMAKYHEALMNLS
jgi:hypothetical protein